MNAQEMFEKLGWKLVEADFDMGIKYECDWCSIEFRNGLFNHQTYLLRILPSQPFTSLISTDVKFHLAIHQQMKELGWIK